MSVSAFSLGSYVIILIIAVYVTLYRSNLRTSHFVLHSHTTDATDALDERESLVWIVGTITLAVSGSIRLFLEGMNWVTSILNAVTLGTMALAPLVWAWVIVSVTRRWLSRSHAPRSNTKTEKTVVP